MTLNLATATDTYKFNHWSQYPEGTTGVYSYFEARRGAKFDEVVFVGLQPLLRDLEQGVTTSDVDRAEAISFAIHGRDVFNRARWDYIVDKHSGRLPVKIKAVAEGTVVPINNVLFTVENTDPECFWLTSALESFLTHVWHPITVATLSREVKKIIKGYFDRTVDDEVTPLALPYTLHDFGYRGATSHASAGQAGMAHLVNFLGTDTAPALEYIVDHYTSIRSLINDGRSVLDGLGASVPATEHSVMTALGKAGERAQVQRLLDANPTGIISCVADSYSIYKFVQQVGTHFKPQILARAQADETGMTKFVVRPDSLTDEHRSKGELNVYILEELGRYFGTTTNSKGYKVLNPAVGLIDGDGNSIDDIDDTLEAMQRAGWAASNIVFGMGGGLHQKGLDRDTQRFAFKSSAQQRNNGPWTDVQKNPLDRSKTSKAGRLALTKTLDSRKFVTVREGLKPVQVNSDGKDYLRLAFEDGNVVNPLTFEQVRENAKL